MARPTSAGQRVPGGAVVPEGGKPRRLVVIGSIVREPSVKHDDRGCGKGSLVHVAATILYCGVREGQRIGHLDLLLHGAVPFCQQTDPVRPTER